MVTIVMSLFLSVSFFSEIVLANASSGSDLAGIKGYSFEVATLVTSKWTTFHTDLRDGNLLFMAKPCDIFGTGKSVSFEITYNSFNHDLDVGLGKGWTSNLFEMVEEDPLTHHVTYINKTGAKFVFIWDNSLGKYNSPKGFEGNLTKQTNGSYQITDWYYITTNFDTNGKLQKYSRLNLDLITLQYDTAGFPVSIKDPISNRTLTFTWNQSHITEAKDSMNQTWKINYSTDNSKLLSLEKPDQSKTEFTYDTNNFLLTQKDFTGQTYSVSYFSSGNNLNKVSTLTLPNAGVYEFSYNSNISGFASITELKDPENFVKSYFFGSTSHHLEKVAAIDGTSEIKTTYQYDADGFIIATSDSYNQTTSYVRDTTHHIVHISYPPATLGGDTFQVEYLYDTTFPHLKIQKKEKINITPVWAVTSYEYSDPDCPVKPSKQTDPMGTETTYDYNANHQLISVTTGRGSFQDNLTKTKTYTYSATSNPSSYIDAEGNETSYIVNANGFITDQIQFEGPAQNGQVTSNVTYTYDTANQEVEATNVVSNISATKSLDLNGAEVTISTFEGCNFSIVWGLSYLVSLDPGARKGTGNECVDPNPTPINLANLNSLGSLPVDIGVFRPKQIKFTDSSNHESTFEYYANGSLKKATDYLGRSSINALDTFGRVAKITASNNKETTFAYDLNNRLTGKNEEGVGNFVYSYYLNGNIKSKNDPSRGTVYYNYNLLGNLLSDEMGFYSYDLKGNLLTANYFNGSSDTWSYSRDGYLLSRNGKNYLTDKLGNVTNIETEYGNATINYISSRGQMSQITGTNDLGNFSLSYQADNRPAIFTDIDKNNTFHYAWNGNATLAELQNPNQTVQTYTFQGKHPDALQVKKGSSILYASQTDFNTSDQVTSFENHWEANQTTYSETTYATYDSLGRTSELTYASDNQKIQYAYSPASGVLESIAVTGIGTFAISNTSSGKINMIQYPNNGGFESYSYNDNLGRVTNIQYPNNRSLSFSWNSKNQITQIFGADMGNFFSYNITYDGLGKMKNYTKSENGMQTESWLFSYGIFGLEKASRSLYGIQDIVMDFTTDFTGRVLSVNYQQIGGFTGELFYHYDNYGNTSILTNFEGTVVAGYLYKMHNGKITSVYNPNNVVNPLTFNARAGFLMLNAFNDDLKIQINSVGSVNLSGGLIGRIDLRASSGGPTIAGGNQINSSANDSVSPCLEDCEKKGMVKCCKEYRSRVECEKNCNEPGSGNGMNEQDPTDTKEECVKKCGNNCKEWGCCSTGTSPSV
jgi:YD repeat-containing protein